MDTETFLLKNRIEVLETQLASAKEKLLMPSSSYKTFLAEHFDLPEEQLGKIRKFKIGYSRNNAVIGGPMDVKDFEIQFAPDFDRRSITSRENGLLGGRPRKTESQNNSPSYDGVVKT